MIQLSVCYSESSKVYLHRFENARLPTDALLFSLSPDALSSALRHMIERKFEYQLNGRSTAAQRLLNGRSTAAERPLGVRVIVTIRPQAGVGTVSCRPNGEGIPCVEFDRKWREISLTHRVEIQRLRANCFHHSATKALPVEGKEIFGNAIQSSTTRR